MCTMKGLVTNIECDFSGLANSFRFVEILCKVKRSFNQLNRIYINQVNGVLEIS